MSILKRLFGSKNGLSAIERPQDIAGNAPPVKTGEWSIIVDKNGDEVTNRPPSNDDFLARPAIKYKFRGTIPKFNPNQYTDQNKRYGAAMEHSMRAHKNEALLKKAVFLLSQTDDGRRLLKLANDKEFHFVFDEEWMKKEGAAGMCDYANKQIPLAEGRSAEQVALTLKHELQHMEDIANGVTTNSTHTLKSSLMGERALEANARASEAVFAAESLHGSKNGPERQFRTNKILAHFHHKNTPVATAAIAKLDDAKSGNWAAYALAAFKGYYDQHGTLDYYDKRQVDMYEKTLPENPDEFFDATNRNVLKRSKYYSRKEMIEAGERQLKDVATNDRWTQNQDDLKSKITIKGQPSYLDEAKDLDLTNDKYIALGATARAGMNEFILRAKRFIPNTIEQMETALDAPERTGTEPPKTIPSGLEIYAQNENFEIKRLPNRGGGHHSNTTEYEEITARFTKEYERLNYYKFDLERLSLTSEAMLHNTHINMRGNMHRLIDAGYRAPVAAMPQEYILHLCGCARHASETGNPNAFDEQDFIIMKHWEEMSEHGLDPIYDDPKWEADAQYFKRECQPYIDSYLKPFFDTLESKRTARAEMGQQLKAAPA